MMRWSRLIVLASVILAASLIPHSAQSCPICYGDPDSPMTQGMNMAIFSLLGVTGSVLGGLVLFFLYVRRRSLMIHRRFKDMLN